jgi:ribonuclease M5
MEMLRRIAQCRGLIVFTDPDGAGLVIRNYLKGCLPPACVKHAYIPGSTAGRGEKNPPPRGSWVSRACRRRCFMEAIRRSGATLEDSEAPVREDRLTKPSCNAAGLTGTPEAAGRRQMHLRELSLPSQFVVQRIAGCFLNALLSRKRFFA